MNIVVNEKSTSMESLIRQAFCVCEETLGTFRTDYVRLPDAEYFLRVLSDSYDPDKITTKKPKVIVFGTNFPLEIIHALTGKCASVILGGSRIYLDASDESVPRDTDPVTRAVLGQLFAMEEYWKESALVVIPCSSDAQRKAAYLLSERGWKVVTVWIPAVKDADSHLAYCSEIEHAAASICRHVKRRFSASALHRSVRYYNEVRSSIGVFLAAAMENEPMMPGPLRMAILDSFFVADDMNEWHENLKKLTAALQNEPGQKSDRPRVLLIGSPIYVPNCKIPMLIDTSGIEICGCIDSRDAHMTGTLSAEKKVSLKKLAAHYFDSDSSPAFVNNEQLTEAIENAVIMTKPDGVIWHVLKGQIEYDFELNRAEKMFEANNLPVIRLETDYQYQDIEQLRIRIEAFAELLSQKKLEKGEKL